VAHAFIATVEAISQTGAGTEFVDIDERTCNLSVGALEAYLACCRRDPVSRRPIGVRSGKPIKAILPVHLYGQIADMDGLRDVADRYHLEILEDACQAHGAEYHTRAGEWHRAGSFGRAAAFSFYPSKNLGACGDGGAVTTNDEEVARAVGMLRDHGQVQKYVHERIGFNSRLDAIQAAILRVKLRHLDGWNDRRRAAAIRYNNLLSAVPGVLTPDEPPWSRAVYHLYVLRVAQRDTLARALQAEGIQIGLHYPIPLHLQNACGRQDTQLPVTERVSAEILSLPMYPGIAADQQERICNAISTFAGVSV
jgi:dTDP-4-amino-4,6-dideoxygalactose transaminase